MLKLALFCLRQEKAAVPERRVEGKMKCGSSPASLFQLAEWRGNVGAVKHQVPIPWQGLTHWSKELFLLSAKCKDSYRSTATHHILLKGEHFLCPTQVLSLTDNRFQFDCDAHQVFVIGPQDFLS